MATAVDTLHARHTKKAYVRRGDTDSCSFSIGTLLAHTENGAPHVRKDVDQTPGFVLR